MATKMSLKLLVDKNRKKVLFAEAGKDLVDFLFSLLTLPVGTIVRLLTPTQTSTGCIGNLYSSVENLDNLYMQPKAEKSQLLEPKIGSCSNEMKKLLMQQSECKGNEKSQSSESMTPSYYGCSGAQGYHESTGSRNCRTSITDVMGTRCGICQQGMTRKLYFFKGVSSSNSSGCCGVGGGGGGGGEGYVKEVVTYMITDDLEVKPMSTISSITLLNWYDVKDIGALEDRVVHLGIEEGLDLLRISLQSKSVLTDVFLKEGISRFKV